MAFQFQKMKMFEGMGLLVSSKPFCLYPAGSFYYPDFGFSPEFSQFTKNYYFKEGIKLE